MTRWAVSDQTWVAACLLLMVGSTSASLAGTPTTGRADALRSILAEYPDQRSFAADREGTIHLVYGDPETMRVFYRTLDAQGRPQMSPMLLNRDIEATVARERGPRIALGQQQAVYVLWQNSDGLVCLRSERRGAQARFERVKVLDRHVAIDVPTLTSDPAGRVYAIWVDGRHKPDDPLGSELYMAATLDTPRPPLAEPSLRDRGEADGVSKATGEDSAFGPNFKVSDDRYLVCPCCMPEVVCRGETIFVLYRSTRNGIKEMVLRRANRRDLNWRTTVISRDRWRFHGCPMSGGHIAMTPDRVAIVWTANGQVNAAFSRDDGRNFSAPARLAAEQTLSRRNRTSDLKDLARRVATGELEGTPPETSKPENVSR